MHKFLLLIVAAMLCFFKLESQSNVGIGTTTPVNKLDVEGGLAVGTVFSGTWQAPANGAIIQGSVGIGIESPELYAKLHVYSNQAYILLERDAGAYSQSGFIFRRAGLDKWGLTENWTSPTDNFAIYDFSINQKVFQINPGGNIGLGVIPVNKLDVAGGLALGYTYSGQYTAPANGAIIEGNVGIGTSAPANKLDVEGGLAVGAGYSGASTTPTNGAIIEGNVGIGTSTPNSKLHVNGALKVVDGTQGAGKILTSDATGLASWQPPPPPPPTYFASVTICCQSWTTKNLDVSTYRNGDAIPKVTDATAWGALTTGAYCYYNNDSTTYAATYGKLYNWYAVNDPRGLAPEGWHIPSDFEWTTLGNCLSGDPVAGGPMKEIGIPPWFPPNTGATNLSNFTGLPGGIRDNSGSYFFIGDGSFWWSSTGSTSSLSWYRQLSSSNTNLSRATVNKRYGFSLRCIRD